MKKFISRYDFTLLLCLVLVGVLLWHIQDSRERFQQLEDTNLAMARENNRLAQELSLVETKGLLRDHWVGYSDIDEREKTIKFHLTLVPRAYGPETRVSAVCNGETLALEWDNNGTYRTTLTAPLEESCQITSVSVAQGEETKQVDMAWELMDYQDFTPRFTSGGFYPDYYGSGDEDTCLVEGMIHLENAKGYAVEVGLGNNTGTLRTLVDGEIVEETPVKWEDFGTMYRTEPKISVSMVPGQVTECVLVLTDAQGLAFHYTAFRYQAEETRADFFRAHQCDISTQVYGPGGTLLYTLPGDGSIPNTEEEGIQWKG